MERPSVVTLLAASPTSTRDMGAVALLCLAFCSHPSAWCGPAGMGRWCQQASSLTSSPYIFQNPEQRRIVSWCSSVPPPSSLVCFQRNQLFLPQRLQENAPVALHSAAPSPSLASRVYLPSSPPRCLRSLFVSPTPALQRPG